MSPLDIYYAQEGFRSKNLKQVYKMKAIRRIKRHAFSNLKYLLPTSIVTNLSIIVFAGVSPLTLYQDIKTISTRHITPTNLDQQVPLGIYNCIH